MYLKVQITSKVIEMKARIYREQDKITQKGTARLNCWYLVYSNSEKEIDPLIGWTGSFRPNSQVKLKFDSKEEAIKYAQKNSISFESIFKRNNSTAPKSYSDNFIK